MKQVLYSGNHLPNPPPSLFPLTPALVILYSGILLRYSSYLKFSRLLKKWLFLRLLKNTPAFAPRGGATRRQADAS
jgi:hypothetical protein